MTRLSRSHIGILDFGRVEDDGDPRTTVEATVRLAAHADQLGFGRYWLAEHHAPRSAWGNPLTLLSRLGAATNRIRIGTGGTLLRYHDPYAVASDVALLSWLHPDRIDIGFARGRPSIETGQVASEEQADNIAGDYEERVRLTMGLFSERSRCVQWKSEWPTTTSPPVSVPEPECWLLGSSIESARIAAAVGTPFACTLLHSPDPDVRGVDVYRAAFIAGLEPRPRLGVAVAGLLAPTMADAQRAHADRILGDIVHPTVVGTPGHCRDVLDALREDLEPDVILYLDVTRDPLERLQSLELLATAVS
jgi:luciferase family oxidoreductase group 1